MSGQHNHVVFMLFCTKYIPEGMFVVKGDNHIAYFGQLLCMTVSEHITHPLINGPLQLNAAHVNQQASIPDFLSIFFPTMGLKLGYSGFAHDQKPCVINLYHLYLLRS